MPNGNGLNFTLTFFLFLITANKILIMKASLYVLIIFLCREAFSQGEISNPAYNVGPHSESLDLPSQSNRSGGVINYNHYDLNQNSYNGGNRDITEIDRVIPSNEKYSNEEFLDGNLIYSSGNQSEVVKMNYHLLYEEMQFIGKKGDTLFVADTDSIAFVRLGKALYLHTSLNEYLKIISGNNQMKLCSLQKLKLNEGYPASGGVFNVPIEYKVLSKKEDYYLVGKETRYVATKSGFHMAFPKFKQQIGGYLQQMARQRTPIKFYKEEDLVTLLTFCTSLN